MRSALPSRLEEVSPQRRGSRYREIKKATLAGALVNLGLALGKIICGSVGQSQALIADGVHSLSDLSTDALVLFAARHAGRGADAEHPYGHGRFETLAAVALGVFLMMVALGVCWDAGRRLLDPQNLPRPGLLALAAAFISVLANEGLYRYTLGVARKLRSIMLKANAWHHRSDALSSIVVMLGVGGAMAGLEYLDSIAAIGVGLMIAKVGWDLGASGVRELVDTGLGPEEVAAVRNTILSVGGVKTLHRLRTRRMGADVLVDVHIQVAPELSVSEGHMISETARGKLIGGLEDVTDVTVHIDPEDDETGAPCCGLPLRGALSAPLRERWRDIEAANHIERITLHYLDGKVSVELLLPLSLAADPDRARMLADQFNRKVRDLEDIRSVTLLYH